MGTPNKNSSSIFPKINEKLAYRTLALVIVVGGLTWGMEWFLKVQGDLGGLSKSETAGWICAVEMLPKGQGQLAVLVTPDGQVRKDPGYVANSLDRDLTWSPHGNFLYFVSDEKDHSFNVQRWSVSDGKVEQRTLGSRARSNLKFPAQVSDDPDSDAKGLLTTGGIVNEFDPHTMDTPQILPPTQKEIGQVQGGEDQGGIAGEFEGAYGTLGTSFREAQWCGNKKYIVAIMRRESGESLVLQEMVAVDGKLPQPRELIAGDHVDFAVNPKDGNVLYCVQGFQWPQTMPGDPDKPRAKPFINAMGVYVCDGKGYMLASNKGDLTFDAPAISPDGKQVAIVIGKVQNGEVAVQGLATFPTVSDPNFKPQRFPGDIHEPSWNADGTHIAVAMREPGKNRAIYELSLDGSPPRNLTGDAGDFAYPRYSPQQKTN